MKAVCVTACEVDGLGIVTPGETVELHDGLADDVRINLHFVIDRSTVKNAGEKVPDYKKLDEERLEAFRRSLVNQTDMTKALNVLIDEGIELPADVIESGLVTDVERIRRIGEIWIENFGYTFPTDPKDDPKTPAEKKGAARNRGAGKTPAGRPAGAKGEGDGDGEPGEAAADGDLFSRK